MAVQDGSTSPSVLPLDGVDASGNAGRFPGEVGETEYEDQVEDAKDFLISDNLSSTPSQPVLELPRETARPGEKTAQILNRFILYETASRFYLVGQDISERRYRILKIDRMAPPGMLNIFEDEIVYDKRAKDELLTTIDEGNKASGGLKMKCNAWGILGFIRFTEAYYMVLITKRTAAAVLGGHYIYQIEATEVIPLTTGSTSRFQRDRNPEETHYLGIFSNIELAKSFYFSYTYNITRTLQHNICHLRSSWKEGLVRPVPELNDMFIWNHHLLEPAKDALKVPFNWCVSIIHGFIEQHCEYASPLMIKTD
jgi:phosphatidylinositol 3,5-bisphosphate 5-phosphatase